MSVEGESGFDAEGVAGAESTGFDSGLVEGIPECGGVGCAADQLKTVFTGVAGSSGECGDSGDFDGSGAEKCESFEVFGLLGEGIDDFSGFRALDGDHCGFAGLIGERDSGGEEGFDVNEIFLVVSGIHNHAVGVGGDAVDDDVVYNSAVCVGKHGVLALIVGESGDIVDGHMFEEFEDIFASESEARHVGDVKHSGSVADGLSFGDDRFVLDGEFESGEFDHSSVEAHVVGVEGGC